MIKTFMSAACMASLLYGASATALTATQTVQREVIVTQQDGTEDIIREAATTALPGERIVYSLNYFNDAEQPAENIVLTMPIPVEITYMEGSAVSDDTKVQYSVDDGKTFAERGKLQVAEEDGSMRLAEANDITHIRWEVTEAVAPGARGVIEFKGLLK